MERCSLIVLEVVFLSSGKSWIRGKVLIYRSFGSRLEKGRLILCAWRLIFRLLEIGSWSRRSCVFNYTAHPCIWSVKGRNECFLEIFLLVSNISMLILTWSRLFLNISRDVKHSLDFQRIMNPLSICSFIVLIEHSFNFVSPWPNLLWCAIYTFVHSENRIFKAIFCWTEELMFRILILYI